MTRGGVLAMGLAATVLGWGGCDEPVHAGPVAVIAESGEAVELRYEAANDTAVSRLPLHRAGAVRYFSAGVGLEERAAEYPPFPLKIVFTAGGKPFLSGVAVTIQPAKGGPAWSIPREQVEGPWLFVDLPNGFYDVMAEYGGQTQSLKGVKVQAGRLRTVYLRWDRDHGVATALPGD